MKLKDRFNKINGYPMEGSTYGYIMLVALGKYKQADKLLEDMGDGDK
jgi:hypothetical protein